MDQASWEKIEEIFHAARNIPAEKRAAFLESACDGDNELKNEVESLIYYSENDDVLSDNQYLYLGLDLLCKEKQQSLIGKKFGRYEIIKLLGQGGMGEVYQAMDSTLNRLVALKLLPDFMLENDENIHRFQQEALTASAISHPNIAHIYEAGIENNQQFIAMELIEGITLRELLREKKIDVITALDIFWQTANALACAHQEGIIHRDIKPENIMIRPDGYVKVLDFGIAKLSEPNASEQNPKSGKRYSQSIIHNLQITRAGLILGTIGYISLEQLNNKNVDLRTDIWSLGIVLYEVLSGNKPFKGKTTDELRREILLNSPPPISFSNLNSNDEAFLQKILARMLDKDKEKRYKSAYELAKDLKELKHNLEYTQQFSTGEIIDGAVTQRFFKTFEGTGNSSFIEKSKQFWTQQSLSRKALVMAVVIGFLTFTVGVSIQYFSRFYATKPPKFESFSSDSRHRLQISTLFGVRKKLQGSIPFISFSPDGNSISFVMSGEGMDDIYIKQLNQNEFTRLTDGKWIYQTPVWSPDGKQIAFVSNRDNTNAIWTISPQGGTPVLKTNLDINFVSCQLLKWSNDTKRLFFHSGRTLKTIELDSGRIEEIKFPVENVVTAFNISADESLAAFVSTSGGTSKLWIYNLKNKELTEIANEANLNLFPVILPDNKRVVYSSNQNGNSQLYIEDFINKKNSQITFGDSNAYGPVVSPDGNRIVYVSENNMANVFSMDVNSKKELRLTEATKMQLFPVLSKDLTNLVFQVAEEYSNFTQSPLKLKNLQTNNERVLDGQTGFWAKWSPARDEIAYLRHQGREFNIWKTEFPDNQMKQLTAGGILTGGYATAPFNMLTIPFNWSPDGRKIAFVSKQSGSENVWVINSDGANQQMLTGNNDPKTGYNSAIWSPDSGKIGFTRRIQTEPIKFRYVISVFSNNQVKELFQGDRKMRILGWNINGTNLLAAVDNSTETEIYALSETAAPKLLTKLIRSDFPSISLSPDGRTIAFSSVRNGVYNIYSYSINGKEKQITDNKEDTILFSGISWSPAGDRIFYSKQSGGMQISMISDNPE
jgi:serine/threonine protein kinase/dipeptidyl aminopeptidase/acylaminoacyl peptidase